MDFTDRDVLDRAREMRHQDTRAERRLWTWLRNRRFGNYKFRRQYPVGRHIVDFYCRDLKLAIEADGAQHFSIAVADQDTLRTIDLQSYGIRILRLANETIMREPDVACDSIQWAIERIRANEFPISRGLGTVRRG